MEGVVVVLCGREVAAQGIAARRNGRLSAITLVLNLAQTDMGFISSASDQGCPRIVALDVPVVVVEKALVSHTQYGERKGWVLALFT